MHLRSSTRPIESDSPTIDWTLALAGGDGVRLADYVERRFGHRLPKQYCCLLGKRSMLQHTLDRLNRITPASRTLTVIGTNHLELALEQLQGRSDHVFRQPSSRDTGVALYVALAMIQRWAPNGIVTITPADHYVAPAHAYIEHIRVARDLASRLRDKVVVVGARPTDVDPELGYLSLGEPLPGVPKVRSVVGFVEKPPAVVAKELQHQGALWNTMVTCGTVGALWELARAVQPEMIELLEFLVPLIGMPDEFDAIDYVYRTLPKISFSRDILEHTPERLVAMALDGVEWSDWGRSERIETVIALQRTREPVVEPHTLEPRVAEQVSAS